MRVLVTGGAGFIGFYTIKKLLQKGYQVIGLDNVNDYYSTQLKFDRLKELGILKSDAQKFNNKVYSETFSNFTFIRLNLEDKNSLDHLFEEEAINVVCHLGAQAGVRYSIENPKTYIESNINGFFNVLECCRNFNINHLVYASSSSVYGLNKEVPFKTSDNVDFPISLYAATKKSNELMAYTYSHLYNFKTTGLRFFTVYGPWGRPDMAMFLFTQNIIKNKTIRVFNNGKMERDFTYIDDIVEGVIRIIENTKKERVNYKVYNIGHGKPVKLLDFISTIETKLNKKAIKEFLPNQPGDVTRTWADVSDLVRDYGHEPKISITDGVASFINWYKKYYKT